MAIYTDFVLDSRKTLSSVSTVTDVDAINNSLKNIFSTPLGSLHGKPRFGTRLFQVVFDFIDFSTETLIRALIDEEVAKQEPRITVRDVQILSVPEYNKIIITIYYTFLNETLQAGTAKIGISF